MKLISGLSMAARLALGFGTILVLLLGMASLSLVRMQAMASTLQEITVQNAARSQTLDVMGRNVALYVQTLGDLGSTDMEGGVAVLTRARAALRDYEAAQTRIVGMLPASADVQALMERVKVSARAAQQLLALGEKQAEGRGPTAQAFQVRNEYSKDTAHWSARQQAWGKAVNDLSDWHDAANAVLSATATADAQIARTAIIGGALLAFAFGSALAVWLVRDIKGAIHAAVEATRRMARHDLSHPINTHRKDEIGGLLSALETMRLNLHQLAAGVRVTSDDINNASNEIAQGSLNLSARTEDAANTLQTTLSAIALINASVGETTAAARSAQLLSGEASDVATRSGTVMAQVVATMGEIDVASRKISDITSLIDGIAFQTNILALNAAVEAARAGEQGRGFAVVASEVRALASRSASAAREIKVLINASLEKVASGTAQVDRAGSTTAAVTSSVHQVSAKVAAIAAEADQQVDRIGEANRSVGQLDLMAHQNAALAEQSAAAAASLRQQASQLTELVSQFELGRPGASEVAVRPHSISYSG